MAEAVAGRRRRAGSYPGEKRRNVAGEHLGLFGRGEVPAPRHRCPPAHVVEAFDPLADWGALVDVRMGKDRDAGWHLDEIPGSKCDSELPVVVVEVVPHRGGD